MTVCNMSIEWGAKAGLVAPDETTFAYLKGRPEAPVGETWDAAVAHWRTLVTDDDATFDREIELDAGTMTPFVTWGTNPGQGVPLSGSIPDPEGYEEESDRVGARKALDYMGLDAGTPMRDIAIDTVFVGSCTNGRIEDLDVIFKEAGGEWRGAGCSMCLGMNPDQLAPQERSASTSNRNFEGRQGKGGRTHLVSVPVAAATAIRGTLSSPADLEPVQEV